MGLGIRNRGKPAVPLPASSIKLPPQFPGDGLQVHEVAEAATSAFPVERGAGVSGVRERHFSRVHLTF